METKKAKVIIAGDIVVSSGHKVVILDEKLENVIREVDYSIVNFEAPVKTKYSKPIKKTGANLHQSADIIDALKQKGFNCFSLANNHFRDFGYDGCKNTLNLLKAKCLDFMGGGINLQEASRIMYKKLNGLCVAFINVCEQEWSIATADRPGANPCKPLTQFYQIKEAKKKADFVIIIYHGGVEHYQLPSPELKQLHRFLIDSGADAVINHHQHCFSGYEIYNGKPIFYGIGNFLFDNNSIINSPWNYGYLVELTISKLEGVSFCLHPYKQCNGEFGVFKLKDEEDFHTRINELNDIIANDELLRQHYVEYVTKDRSFYTPVVIPYRSRILKRLCRYGLLPTFMSEDQLRYVYDVVNCDSHRTRFIDFLESKFS